MISELRFARKEWGYWSRCWRREHCGDKTYEKIPELTLGKNVWIGLLKKIKEERRERRDEREKR